MRKENVFLIVAIFVVLVGGIFFLREGKKYLEQKKIIETEKILECLSKNEVELYVISNCSYCDKQLDIFGNARDKLKVISCDASGIWDKRCKEKKINSFPLWLARVDKNLKIPQTLISCDECKKNNKSIYCEELCYTKTEDGNYFKIIGILEMEKIKEVFDCQGKDKD